MFVMQRSLFELKCTLCWLPCAGVTAALPSPPSAASGGLAVSGGPVTNFSVHPAQLAGSPPPAGAQTAASPGSLSHYGTYRKKEAKENKGMK